MKFIFLFLYFIPTILFPQTKLPFKVGNGWNYIGNSQIWGGRIISSYQENGYDYYIFDNKIATLPFIRNTRIDGNNIHSEYLNYDINSMNHRWRPFYFGDQKKGELIIYNDTTYNVNEITGETIIRIQAIEFHYTEKLPIYIFGKMDSVEMRVINFGIISWYQGYSSKYGLIFEQNSEGDIGESGDRNLLGCLIDGIAYGDTIGLVCVEPTSPTLPLNPVLFQNYPNPFNPETIIPFSLPISTNIRLSVFDLTGREVSVLRNGYMPAGLYLEPFTSSRMSSGAYIIRLQAGNQTLSKVIILNK